mmetsp:Transcript_24294/g.57537  ORF Transcript_24294/g.57537 Transcript_24294/m.57537 type:complete len:624 (+) Transcript_24294:102-1973(+)
MLTRPFSRLVVAFGIRRVTQRRVVEECVVGVLLLIPFGFMVGLFTSRICTKIKIPFIRSDVWTTIVVFLVGDILMEWLLPSLSCLPVPSLADDGLYGGGRGDYYYDDPGEGTIDKSWSYEGYHYSSTWVLQSFGLSCPEDFASTETLLSPDATAVLFSIRLIFLCIGVHLGESLCWVALTGGIATGKTTVGRLLVDCEVVETEEEEEEYGNENEDSSKTKNNNEGGSNNTNKKSNGSNIKKRTTPAGASSSNSHGGKRKSKKGSAGDGRDGQVGSTRNTTDTRNAAGGEASNKGNNDSSNNKKNGGQKAAATASTAAPVVDDSFKEGTVNLICGDTIAHEVLLPPEILALGRRSTAINATIAAAAAASQTSTASTTTTTSTTATISVSHHGGASRNGVVVVDGDEEEDNDAFIVRPEDSIYYDILEAFEGHDILASSSSSSDDRVDGIVCIDRIKLGSVIFNDRTERKKLNAITHPRILYVLVRKLLQSVFFSMTDITIADIPLLFESGKLSWFFAVTVCVTVDDPAIQLERLMNRNPNLSMEECQARIDSQMPLKKKEQSADIVINNTGDLEELSKQVEDVRRDLMGRIFGIGMSLLQMLLLIGGSTSIAVSSKFYTESEEE